MTSQTIVIVHDEPALLALLEDILEKPFDVDALLVRVTERLAASRG